MNLMIAIQVVSWVLQFVGHGVYEKRAPAIFTNLFYSTYAPFFVVFELLHIIFGYKDSLIKECNKLIAIEVKQYRESKNKKE